MRQDSQTVPVTVTVHAPQHHPSGHPGGGLPFTGAPLDVMAAIGLVLGLAGAAVMTAVRRKSTAPPTDRLGSPA
jgi:hypothetical protein